GGVAVAFNLAEGGGQQTLTGSFGVAASVNSITDTTRAFIADSAVQAGGALAVHAVSTAVIDALTLGGTVAATVGQTSTFTFDGAGAGSGNTVHDTVEAFIDRHFLFHVGSTTALVNSLNGGQVPAALRDAFKAQGITLSAGATTASVTAGE